MEAEEARRHPNNERAYGRFRGVPSGAAPRGQARSKFRKELGCASSRRQDAAGEVQGDHQPSGSGRKAAFAFRSFTFDEVAIILFDDQYRIWRAVRIPLALAEERSTFHSHVNGHILFAKDALLDDSQAIDIIDKLRALAGDV